jgi:hypothetical protein
MLDAGVGGPGVHSLTTPEGWNMSSPSIQSDEIASDDAELLQRLRTLIGRDCQHLGRRCKLIEVLAEEAALVLETRGGLPPIQTDQYGHAAYRANEIVQVPIFGGDGGHLSAELMSLLPCLEACAGQED